MLEGSRLTYMENYQESVNAQPDVNAPRFDKEGQNEIRAISSGNQALQIARRLESEDGQGSFYSGYGYTGNSSVTRDIRRARVLAAFNGEPPYSQKQLEEKGEGWRKNVSFGFCEGVIGRAFAAYTDFVQSQQFIGQIEADLPDEKKFIVQEEFSNAILEWGEWPNHISLTVMENLLYGWVTNVLPDEFDPWPYFIHQKDSFVHILSRKNVKDLPVFVWRKTFLIHELYEKIKDPQIAEQAGWNVENTRKAIEGAMPQNTNPMFKGWQSVEEAIRDGYAYFTMVGGKVIECYYVFAREMSGKVSNFIVLNDKAASKTSGELFRKYDRFNSFEDLLVYFDLEVGDGHWHGSRGLGQRIYNTHRAIDQTRCDILDKALMGGKPILQASDQAGQTDMQLAVFGPFTVIPAGLTVQTSAIPNIPDTAFQADALLSATAEQRVGDVVPNTISSTTGREKTATQSKIDASRQSAISKSNLQRFVDPMSKLLSLILRRLLIPNSPNVDAQKFQAKLVEKGLTPDDLGKILGAKMNGRIEDVFGELSQGIGAAFQEFRNDPSVDQIELKRLELQRLVGSRNVGSLIIEKDDNSRDIEAIRQQELEISSIVNSALPVPASPRDNNLLHLQTGIQWIQGELVKSQHGEQAATPKQIDMVAHHLIQHLQFLQQDKSVNPDQLRQMEGALKQLLQTVEGHMNQAHQATQQPQMQNSNAPQDNSVTSIQ